MYTSDSDIYYAICPHCAADVPCRPIGENIVFGLCDKCETPVEQQMSEIGEKEKQWEYEVKGARVYEKVSGSSGFKYSP